MGTENGRESFVFMPRKFLAGVATPTYDETKPALRCGELQGPLLLRIVAN